MSSERLIVPHRDVSTSVRCGDEKANSGGDTLWILLCYLFQLVHDILHYLPCCLVGVGNRVANNKTKRRREICRILVHYFISSMSGLGVNVKTNSYLVFGLQNPFYSRNEFELECYCSVSFFSQLILSETSPLSLGRQTQDVCQPTLEMNLEDAPIKGTGEDPLMLPIITSTDLTRAGGVPEPSLHCDWLEILEAEERHLRSGGQVSDCNFAPPFAAYRRLEPAQTKLVNMYPTSASRFLGVKRFGHL